MDQTQVSTSGPIVTEYGGIGGFDINELIGASMGPVGVPEIASLMGNEVVQVNTAAYCPPQAENSFFQNEFYSDRLTAENRTLRAKLEYFESESLYWKFEESCYIKEKEFWKNETELWKGDAERWKSDAERLKSDAERLKRDAERLKRDGEKSKRDGEKWKSEAENMKVASTYWQNETWQWKSDANNWQAESFKWKTVADKTRVEYNKVITQNKDMLRLLKDSENAKATSSKKFQSTIQKLTSEAEEKDKVIAKLKKELLHEQHGQAIVHAELKAQTEAVQLAKNHEKMVVADLRNKALAKEKALQRKMTNQTIKYENFAVETHGKVKELEGKVLSLQNEVEEKASIMSAFGKHCGRLTEEIRLANVEVRNLKDFMAELTIDLQDNMGNFMQRYKLSVAPGHELESKWEWRTKEEKCLVRHLRVLVALTDDTFREWEENGLLKKKQICGAGDTTGNADGTGDVEVIMEKKRPEKRRLPGRSSIAPVAGTSGSFKKMKF